ncbi:hypothetical protein B0H13DRAFT_1158163 [Mycena leptocephala]|nr:hypothetical protein B0H13DRAFT_1158163 [Mycena leptocephala]
MNSAITEVHKCMATMAVCEERWQTAGLFYDLLHELAAIGEVPLSQEVSPSVSPSVSPTPATTHKRGREDDDAAQYPRAPASPYSILLTAIHIHRHQHRPSTPPCLQPRARQARSNLHGRPWAASRVSPARGAAGEYQHLVPDAISSPAWLSRFRVGADNTTSNGASVFNVDPLFAPSGGYTTIGMAGDGMSSDVMAMFANAPTGFEVDDWGMYFSVMSELNQDTAGRQL